MGVWGYSVPKGTPASLAGHKASQVLLGHSWGLQGFPPRISLGLAKEGRHPRSQHGSGALIKMLDFDWMALPNITFRTMRLGSDQARLFN